MSDLYTSLRVSPRKKRALPEDDDNLLTTKKMRIAHPTPPATPSRKSTTKGPFGKPAATPLPSHLDRLYKIQTALHHALSQALATCGLSPSETGIVRNVVNHIQLNSRPSFTTKFDTDDLKRLCWLWEWDGKELPSNTSKGKGKATSDDEDNPFLEEKPAPPVTRDWTRGSMGFILSQGSHHSKATGSRVNAYCIGIEVEMDIDKGMGGGMTAVARWTSGIETRQTEFRKKLERWVELNKDQLPIPIIPLADIPSLPATAKSSTLTRLLASSSPKSPSSSSILATPNSPTFSSISRSPSKSPTKRPLREFAIPFPVTPSSRATSPSKSPVKSSILFPKTPSSRHRDEDENPFITPSHASTPATPVPDTPSSVSSSPPSTPVHQRGRNASTAPKTPTSSRRAALYDRIRQKSEAAQTPTKAKLGLEQTPKMSKEQLMKLGREEMRRRCLLGRLSGVAESVWMLFSNPGSGATRKRRVLPTSEVIAAVLKSSPVPMSSADAQESMDMLVSLCPFFLRKIDVGSEEWLEMPATSNNTDALSGGGSPGKVPGSPGKNRGKDDSAQELLTRSPKRVKREGGGLREVRERIRRELESQD